MRLRNLRGSNSLLHRMDRPCALLLLRGLTLVDQDKNMDNGEGQRHQKETALPHHFACLRPLRTALPRRPGTIPKHQESPLNTTEILHHLTNRTLLLREHNTHIKALLRTPKVDLWMTDYLLKGRLVNRLTVWPLVTASIKTRRMGQGYPALILA
jgi:hypothetical protein